MGKTLWKDEIDALFEAARSSTAGSARPGVRADVRPRATAFNFSSSGQMSDEQLRALSVLSDLFASNLTHNLAAWLRTRVQVDLVSVEQIRFNEFLQRIPEISYVASVRLEPLGALSVLQLDLALAPPVIDLLLGGEGREGPLREPTDIEESILDSVVEVICRELTAVWQPVGQNFNFERRQMQTEAARIMPANEKSLCLSFEIRMPHGSGLLNLVFPAVAASNILRRLTSDLGRRRRHDGETRARQLWVANHRGGRAQEAAGDLTMPVLKRWRAEIQAPGSLAQSPAIDRDMRAAVGTSGRNGPGGRTKPARTGWLESCANAGCRSGWLNLWRRRSAPVFEGGWSCSPACTRTLVVAAVRRELEGRVAATEAHRHRIPLGLTMLEQGWITKGQLRLALEAQKAAGGGRVGQWLVRQQGVSEILVTRALGLQWSCPVLPLEFHDAEALTVFLPRLFVDAFGALPLRVAAGKVLYVGFEERLDSVLALAIERMTGLRVECGVVQGSLFGPTHTRMLNSKFPSVELIEASSEAAAVHALSKAIEKTRPVGSRLVRVHDCLWLRMEVAPRRGPLPDAASVQDLICSIGAH